MKAVLKENLIQLKLHLEFGAFVTWNTSKINKKEIVFFIKFIDFF
jgi:uncharacterized Rmd1/YagE family protein